MLLVDDDPRFRALARRTLVADDIDVVAEVENGTDVVAAVALGAKFGLVGRAYLYGLMAGGREGVDRMIEILSDEVIRTMKLLGVSSLDELEPRHVTQLTRLTPVRPNVKAAADALAR